MAAVKARHWRTVKVSAGPCGSFESRMAISCLPGASVSTATSTQLPPDELLWLLLRHVTRDRSGVGIPRLLRVWSRHAASHLIDELSGPLRGERRRAQVVEDKRIPLDVGGRLQ